MMRDINSSQPPVKTGPGDGYYKAQWPMSWWSWHTFNMLFIGFLASIGLCIGFGHEQFMLGTVIGALGITAVRRVP